jgi:hypothetical protein
MQPDQPPPGEPAPARRLASAAAATCGTACAGACAPSLLGLLGLSGSSALLVTWTERLRPLFLIVSLVALAVAFHRAYRRRPSGGPRRFADSPAFVWLMTAFCALAFAVPYASARRGDTAAAAAPCAQPCPPSPPCPPRRQGSVGPKGSISP